MVIFVFPLRFFGQERPAGGLIPTCWPFLWPCVFLLLHDRCGTGTLNEVEFLLGTGDGNVPEVALLLEGIRRLVATTDGKLVEPKDEHPVHLQTLGPVDGREGDRSTIVIEQGFDPSRQILTGRALREPLVAHHDRLAHVVERFDLDVGVVLRLEPHATNGNQFFQTLTEFREHEVRKLGNVANDLRHRLPDLLALDLGCTSVTDQREAELDERCGEPAEDKIVGLQHRNEASIGNVLHDAIGSRLASFDLRNVLLRQFHHLLGASVADREREFLRVHEIPETREALGVGTSELVNGLPWVSHHDHAGLGVACAENEFGLSAGKVLSFVDEHCVVLRHREVLDNREPEHVSEIDQPVGLHLPASLFEDVGQSLLIVAHHFRVDLFGEVVFAGQIEDGFGVRRLDHHNPRQVDEVHESRCDFVLGLIVATVGREQGFDDRVDVRLRQFAVLAGIRFTEGVPQSRPQNLEPECVNGRYVHFLRESAAEFLPDVDVERAEQRRGWVNSLCCFNDRRGLAGTSYRVDRDVGLASFDCREDCELEGRKVHVFLHCY